MKEKSRDDKVKEFLSIAIYESPYKDLSYEAKEYVENVLSRLNNIYKVKVDEKRLINNIRPIIKQSLINIYKGAYEDKSSVGCSYAPDLSAEKELLKIVHAIAEKVEEWMR